MKSGRPGHVVDLPDAAGCRLVGVKKHRSAKAGYKKPGSDEVGTRSPTWRLNYPTFAYYYTPLIAIAAAMKTISLGEKTTMTVSRSTKFKSIQIELQKKKDGGGVRKAYMTPKSCRTMLTLQREVQAIAALLKQKPLAVDAADGEAEADSRDDGGRVVELPLDDRRSLSVRKWHANGSVSIVLETMKDGEKQPAFNFNLDEDEWATLHREAATINEAIDALTTNLYAEKDDRIKMYRWFIVTPDGGQVGDVASNWQYSERDAQTDAKENAKPGYTWHLEYKLIKPPSKDTIHNAVTAYLIRQNIATIRRDQCPGCEGDLQPNQLAHVGFDGFGCLDPLSEVDDALYRRAAANLSPMAMADLYHSIASVLKIPTTTATAGPMVKISPDQLKAITLTQTTWQWEDLIDLCGAIHLKETMDLLPSLL